MSRAPQLLSRARCHLFAAFALLSLVVACEGSTIGADDVDQLDGQTAELIARGVALVYPGDSIEAWYMNGTAVSQAMAFAAPTSAVLSILMQRASPGSPSAIIMTVRQTAIPPAQPKPAGPRMPLYLVDGAAVTPAQARTALGRSDIQSIEIIKPEAASATYTQPAAVNGVIKITTGGTAK